MGFGVRFRLGPLVYTEQLDDGSRPARPPVDRGPVLPLKPAPRWTSRVIVFVLLLGPALAGLYALMGPGR